MKSMVLSTVLLAALAAPFAAGPAQAGDKCTVPQAEWQPQQALRQKLEGEGWQIRKLKIDDGCYEVYGTTADGKRMEVYFDPKTFAVVKSETQG